MQDDEDFLVEVINWHSKLAVKKSVVPTTRPERVKRLKNEAYGLRFFADLAKNHPEINLYIPKLYEADDKFIVTEFIDSPPLGDSQNNLRKLAKTLADLDRLEPYGRAKVTSNFDYRNIRQRFPIWVEKSLAAGIITPAQVYKANEILDSLEQYIQPRIAHGDLSPYAHAFVLSDGKIALIDFEVFTPRGARYYDVARCYTRLYSYAESTDAPKYFLKSFMELSDDVEHRQEQLLAILVQRTVGMQRDSAIDAGKGQDYKQRAAELLDLVLQGRLELLHL